MGSKPERGLARTNRSATGADAATVDQSSRSPARGPLARVEPALAGPWGRAGTACVAGAIATLALPPLGWLPVLWLAFPALFALWWTAPSPWAAGRVVWLFAFAYFVASLYWISFALLIDPEQHGWLLPFAMVGLPLLLAFFPAITLGAGHALARRMRALRSSRWRLAVGIFAGAWLGSEWARGHLFTGFPWNLIGYGLSGWVWPQQGAALVGVYGLSLIVVAAALAPVAGWLACRGDPGRRPRGGVAALAMIAPLAAITVYGAQRVPAETAYVDGVTLRLVQPNISQRDKWNPALRADNINRLLRITGQPPQAGRTITHVIWPEGALYTNLQADRALRERIVAALPSPGAYVLSGGPRAARAENGAVAYYNSLQVLAPRGEVMAVYDKAHLVPFGEYMPFRWLIPYDAVAPGIYDMSPGPGRRTLDVPGAPPVSPLICYEVIFPGSVARDDDRPAWLVNVTNDGWYGETAGPHQHFAIAGMRAVEEGLPLARSAGTGISGLFDAYGRPQHRLALSTGGVIDARLPVATDAPTIYARYGDWTVLALILLGLLGVRSRVPKA